MSRNTRRRQLWWVPFRGVVLAYHALRLRPGIENNTRFYLSHHTQSNSTEQYSSPSSARGTHVLSASCSCSSVLRPHQECRSARVHRFGCVYLLRMTAQRQAHAVALLYFNKESKEKSSFLLVRTGGQKRRVRTLNLPLPSTHLPPVSKEKETNLR